jgi:hypothetical protein
MEFRENSSSSTSNSWPIRSLISTQWLSFKFSFLKAITIGMASLNCSTLTFRLLEIEFSGRLFSSIVQILANWSAFYAMFFTLIYLNYCFSQISVDSSQSLRDLHMRHRRVRLFLKISRFSKLVY